MSSSLKLVADYRGVLTGEQFYQSGEYDVPGQMPQAVAAGLVDAGRAVWLTPPPVSEPVESKRVVKRRTK